MGVTNSNDCWLCAKEGLGGLGNLVGGEAVKGRGLRREGLAAKDCRCSGLDERVELLKLDSVGKLGLCNGRLELLVLDTRRGRLDGSGNTLRNSADVLVSVGLDDDGEERGVRVWGDKGADSRAGDLVSRKGEGGRAWGPLEGRLAAEEVGEDSELGRCLASGTVRNDKGGLGSRVGVRVEGETVLTTKVLCRSRVQRRAAGGTARSERLGDDGSELLGRDSLANNGNVGLCKRRAGKLLDGVKSDGGVGRGKDRVAESTTESNLVSGVDSLGDGVSGSSLGLALDLGQDQFRVLVGVELRGREDGGEQGEVVVSVVRGGGLERLTRRP